VIGWRNRHLYTVSGGTPRENAATTRAILGAGGMTVLERISGTLVG
jgi:hypothetical protein